MEQLIWPEVPAEETFPREAVLPARSRQKASPYLLLGGLYAAGMLWGKEISGSLPPKLAGTADTLLSNFLASFGTGSILSVAMSLFLPAVLLMLLSFLGGFSAVGFLLDLPLLFGKGVVYGIMAANLAESVELPALAILLAPFEALGSFCLIVLTRSSASLSLQLLKALGEGELSREFPLFKSFLTLLGLTALLFLFALLSSAVALEFAPNLL